MSLSSERPTRIFPALTGTCETGRPATRTARTALGRAGCAARKIIVPWRAGEPGWSRGERARRVGRCPGGLAPGMTGIGHLGPAECRLAPLWARLDGCRFDHHVARRDCRRRLELNLRSGGERIAASSGVG